MSTVQAGKQARKQLRLYVPKQCLQSTLTGPSELRKYLVFPMLSFLESATIADQTVTPGSVESATIADQTVTPGSVESVTIADASVTQGSVALGRAMAMLLGTLQ